jgi:hypothetical protein
MGVSRNDAFGSAMRGKARDLDYSKIGLQHCHVEFLQCIIRIHCRNSAILKLEIPLSKLLST